MSWLTTVVPSIAWPATAIALVLLEDGLSCQAIAEVLSLDDDTIRLWYQASAMKGHLPADGGATG